MIPMVGAVLCIVHCECAGLENLLLAFAVLDMVLGIYFAIVSVPFPMTGLLYDTSPENVPEIYRFLWGVFSFRKASAHGFVRLLQFCGGYF